LPRVSNEVTNENIEILTSIRAGPVAQEALVEPALVRE
jgi:hypothetical protein